MSILERPLTTPEVAEYLAVHVNTLKRIPPDQLPYFTIGKRCDRRYEVSDVMRYKRLRSVSEVPKVSMQTARSSV